MLRPLALLAGLCVISIPHMAQTSNLLKNNFFTISGGLFAGDAYGYTFGASAGLQLKRTFSLAITVRQLISDIKLMNEKKLIYDRLNCRMFSLHGHYNVSQTDNARIYLGMGTGYSSSPDAMGKDEEGNSGSRIGYYDSFFVNPATGIESPLANKIFYFVELNYSYHRWTRIYNFEPGFGSTPRKYAQLIFVTAGVRL